MDLKLVLMRTLLCTYCLSGLLETVTSAVCDLDDGQFEPPCG